MMKPLALSIMLLAPLLAVGAQSLGLVPGEKGELYPEVDFFWTYGISPWGSGISLQGTGENNTDRTPRGPGLFQSITTAGHHFSVQGELLSYRWKSESLFLKPWAGIQGDWFGITETGFMDLDDLGPNYRLFFHNVRTITALRPGLGLEAGMENDFLSLEVGGFLAPAFLVTLDQEFSSAAVGTTELDTPLTRHSYRGSGSLAWGAQAQASWKSPWGDIQIQSQAERFSLNYDYVGLGGAIYQSSIDNIDGSVALKTGITALKFHGAHPVLGLRWDWEMNKESSATAWESETSGLKVLIGLGWQGD